MFDPNEVVLGSRGSTFDIEQRPAAQVAPGAILTKPSPLQAKEAHPPVVAVYVAERDAAVVVLVGIDRGIVRLAVHVGEAGDLPPHR